LFGETFGERDHDGELVRKITVDGADAYVCARSEGVRVEALDAHFLEEHSGRIEEQGHGLLCAFLDGGSSWNEPRVHAFAMFASRGRALNRHA
jgi:hypothetical protein